VNEEDIKELWKGQAVEVPMFTPSQMRKEADSFRRRVARRNRVETVAGVITMAVFGFYVWVFPSPLMRIGSLLVIAGVSFVLWQLHRRAPSRSLPPEALGLPFIDYYRGELARQRDALRDAWLWYVAPLLPGFVVFRCGFPLGSMRIGPGWNGMLVDLSAAAVFIGVIWLNRHGARGMQQKLDALDKQAS
jgi:hypothetical protein